MTYADVLAEAWQQHQALRTDDAPTMVSTFAGAGGSSLGYSMAGFRELLAVEWDDHAAEMLRRNLHTDVFHGDISHVVADTVNLAPGELDLLDGSPPCQGFSRANTRSVNVKSDPRNHLFMEFARLIDMWRPKVFVMENVPSMAQGQHVDTFKAVCRTLKTVGPGYRIQAKVILASALGVPQNRRRLILIGTRSDLNIDPARGFPTPLDTPPVTFRQAVAGVEGAGVRGEYIVNRGKMAQMFPHIKPGQDCGDVLAELGKKPSMFSVRRQEYDRPATTITKTVSAVSCILHPSDHRPLSSVELTRVSSFPDEYDWGDSTYPQIHARLGNSVPPLMTRAIATAIRTGILAT